MRLALATLCLLACGRENGENCPDYMRISSGTFTRIGPKLKWTLEVVGIPPELTFNRASVPSDVMEYSWAVDVDPDRDGKRNWQVAVSHFKVNGSTEVTTADILPQTQKDLWQVKDNLMTSVATADVTLTDNTFTMIVDEGAGDDLVNVVDPTQSVWNTFHVFGASSDDRCQDRFKP
jgi:hypothetical protein